ncbi:DNA replication and repair protein RecF [bacterium]|nr:DNA replication and repair protein RecF [bacterium]
MIIDSLTIKNFRSFDSYSTKFNPQLNIIVAPNGAGKSNLLEAIGLIGTGSSVRTSKSREAILWGEHVARVEVLLETATKLAVSITASKKHFFVGGSETNFRDFMPHVSVVYFQPHDLRLVSGGPHNRRLFLDRTLSTINSTYLLVRGEYLKLLTQRNALLKSGRYDEMLFTVIEDPLVERAIDMIIARNNLVSRMNTALLPQEIVLEYLPSPQAMRELLQESAGKGEENLRTTLREYLREKFRELREKEATLGFSLIGPQRDDVKVLIIDPLAPDGLKDILTFGSRGQQRVAVIRLLFTTADIIEQSRGERPILLLDDVFSELDARNRELILHTITKQQTFITAPDESEISMLDFSDASRISIG